MESPRFRVKFFVVVMAVRARNDDAVALAEADFVQDLHIALDRAIGIDQVMPIVDQGSYWRTVLTKCRDPNGRAPVTLEKALKAAKGTFHLLTRESWTLVATRVRFTSRHDENIEDIQGLRQALGQPQEAVDVPP